MPHHSRALVTRVNYLRAYVKHQRFSEELKLTMGEMGWTVKYFLHHAEMWREWQNMSQGRSLPGHVAYAEKQCLMWTNLAQGAEKIFIEKSRDYVRVLPL